MRIAVSSGSPSSSVPVWAMAVTPPVTSVPAFVIHFLEPLMTHCPSSSSAVVSVPPASVPALSSVRPKAQSFSPLRITSPRKYSFCSSVPKVTSGEQPKEM
jgi:hypothetical protein